MLLLFSVYYNYYYCYIYAFVSDAQAVESAS